MSVHVTTNAAASPAKPAPEADRLLVDLNPQPRQAVVHEDSPLLIVAGAGSGKTAAPTCRIAHPVAAGGGVGKILASTFTNKAAAKMRERVVRPVGPRQTQLQRDHTVASTRRNSTLFSLCTCMCRSDSISSRPANIAVYDAQASEGTA